MKLELFFEVFFGFSFLLLVALGCYALVEHTHKEFEKSNEMTAPPIPNGTPAYFYEGADKIEGTITGFKDGYYTLHVTKLLGMEHIIDVGVHHKKIKTQP
jgi:hypothetical protein